ncbi:hypothetical protein BX600DRAFT_319911 [Xylariales sp. PMI_506]|nr:hypothetical protein BX600DRAFT_319911 [Xylariales sp. PMI_506]
MHISSCSNYLFLVLGLFPRWTLAQGKVALYIDFDCKTPSQLEPSTTLPLSTCLVPIGAVGIAIEQFPNCDNGTASMIMYQDTSCARNTFSDSGTYTGWSDITNCYYLYISKSVPGIMFTCDEPATDPQPTSTSSVTASIVAGAATGSVGESKSTSTSSSPAATTTLSTTGSSGSGGSSSDGASSSSTSGLSMSDKIAIGVGLGVGIPSILIALFAWCWPRR